MKNILLAVQTFLLSLLFASCNIGLPIFLYGETGVEERATSARILFGSDLPQVGSNSKYSFIVFTDAHFGETKYPRKEEAFLEAFKNHLRNPDETLRPRFIVNIGDTLDGGHSSEADYFNLVRQSWINAAKEILGVSDYKVYSILGNHDLYNNGWDTWKLRIYPYTSFYFFSINASGGTGFDFLFLDTGNGTLGGPQIENLEYILSQSQRPKIVFMHYPLYAGGIFYFTMDDVTERSRLISDFAKSNVKYVFEGHKHSAYDYDFKNFKEAVISAYLEKKSYGLVTVDESTGGVQFTRCYY